MCSKKELVVYLSKKKMNQQHLKKQDVRETPRPLHTNLA